MTTGAEGGGGGGAMVQLSITCFTPGMLLTDCSHMDLEVASAHSPLNVTTPLSTEAVIPDISFISFFFESMAASIEASLFPQEKKSMDEAIQIITAVKRQRVAFFISVYFIVYAFAAFAAFGLLVNFCNRPGMAAAMAPVTAAGKPNLLARVPTRPPVIALVARPPELRLLSILDKIPVLAAGVAA